jgi:hypothetical protein
LGFAAQVNAAKTKAVVNKIACFIILFFPNFSLFQITKSRISTVTKRLKNKQWQPFPIV